MLPILIGMVPAIKLLAACKYVNFPILPIVGGIVPTNELLYKDRDNNSLRLPRLNGIVPVKPFEYKLILVTAPFALQVTPVHDEIITLPSN